VRRVTFGFLWFLGLWPGTLFVGGAVAAMVSQSASRAPSTYSAGFERGFEAGQVAGQKFGAEFGGIILLGAVLVSVAGTRLAFCRAPQRGEARSPRFSVCPARPAGARTRR